MLKGIPEVVGAKHVFHTSKMDCYQRFSQVVDFTKCNFHIQSNLLPTYHFQLVHLARHVLIGMIKGSTDNSEISECIQASASRRCSMVKVYYEYVIELALKCHIHIWQQPGSQQSRTKSCLRIISNLNPTPRKQSEDPNSGQTSKRKP